MDSGMIVLCCRLFLRVVNADQKALFRYRRWLAGSFLWLGAPHAWILIFVSVQPPYPSPSCPPSPPHLPSPTITPELSTCDSYS
ncbi:unnamed protein product [Tuber melanosporum]|uniref:(Perigord truffle) hypothetical protein n=1 Tax=Tuber melanosporum (strain Mel28) TaxID=656061 RepID=D5GH39_TUBMM|nr:uncharacterized protein GSTUM_00007690001 [Tuber melanosporum]CAZ83832.1 unnamed protein product [Tuber melanosporum]